MCSEVAPSLLCCKEVASRPVRVLNSSDFFDSSCACVCALVCLASATWSSCTAVVPVFVLVAVGRACSVRGKERAFKNPRPFSIQTSARIW